MKCEHVQEYFPEILGCPSDYPEAAEHLKHCAECRALFVLFRKFEEEKKPGLSEARRSENCQRIYRGMRRHDLFVFGRRTLSAAAILLLVLFSLFRNGTADLPSLVAVPDDELYLVSNTEILPQPQISKENIIEYLASYEYIEELGNLF